MAVIQKWGNSQGVRIPKNLLEISNISIDDKLEIIAEENTIIIKKCEPKGHKTLAERFADYDGEYESDEVDWGQSVGREQW